MGISTSMMDFQRIKNEFPIFDQPTPTGENLTYLDSAATTQKPKSVIDSIIKFYSRYNSNIGRGAYWPATEASHSFDKAREKVANFIHSPNGTESVVFTAGTTDSINKIAQSFLIPRLSPNDEVLVSGMEHHSNLIPWQQACKDAQAHLVIAPVLDSGDLDFARLPELISDKTKLIAVTAISNVLGTVIDIPRIAALKGETPLLVDAAQLAPHQVIDVAKLECDFLVFSGHKMYGPTGIGILYGKREFLEEMRPLSFGGGMVLEADYTSSSFRELPAKHEAGTLNIAGAIGLGAAIDFIESLGIDRIQTHLDQLTEYAMNALSGIPEVRIVGTPVLRGPIISFTCADIHPHDIATFLNSKGIAIRTGQHCVQPLINRFGLGATCRISFGLYNTQEDIDHLVESLRHSIRFFTK